MKRKQILRFLSLALSLLLLLALAACGGQQSHDPWTLQGTFTDENDNRLMIYPSDDETQPGWYVTFIQDSGAYGWRIQQEGDALHGNLIPEGEPGEFIVTISREGDGGVALAVENGETYHFTPQALPQAAVKVRINTEGMGQIAYAPEGQALEYDAEAPAQSAQINLEGPEPYVLGAKAEDGWVFVKWTKDGADFAEEPEITVELDGDAEFIAVFEANE